MGSGLLFLLVIAATRRDAVSQIVRAPWARKRLALFGIGGLYLSQITYVITIGYTNAGTATVLQSTFIVIVMLITCLVARRKPRLVEIVGLVLAMGATIIIATQGDFGSLKLPAAGLAWGLLSACAAAGYTMLGRPLYSKWDNFTVVGLGMVAGGIVAFAIWALAFAFPGIDAIASSGNVLGSALLPALDGKGVGVLIVIIVVGTFAAFFLFLNGIAKVGPVQGSQLGAIEPVSATVCAAVLMGTAFSVPDWIGLALMVTTIMLVAAGGKMPENKPSK